MNSDINCLSWSSNSLCMHSQTQSLACGPPASSTYISSFHLAFIPHIVSSHTQISINFYHFRVLGATFFSIPMSGFLKNVRVCVKKLSHMISRLFLCFSSVARGYSWTPRNRRPEKLRDSLKELEVPASSFQ